MDWAERLAAVLGLAALVVLPACSGGSSGKGPTKAVQSAHQPCRASGLALKVGRYGEAGGQFIQTFTFTNVSRNTFEPKSSSIAWRASVPMRLSVAPFSPITIALWPGLST